MNQIDVDELYAQYLNTPVNYGQGDRLPMRKPKTFCSVQPSARTTFVDLPRTDRRIFLASDHHFGHKNIIRYEDRPFVDVNEMDEALITNHNNIVQPDDICIFGGDIAFTSITRANELLARCNGYKILVVGNHDFHKGKLKQYDVDEIHKWLDLTDIGDSNIPKIFTHYPLTNLPNNVHNIHGHIHGSPSPTERHTNVCVEVMQYTPILLVDLIATIDQHYINTHN